MMRAGTTHVASEGTGAPRPKGWGGPLPGGEQYSGDAMSQQPAPKSAPDDAVREGLIPSGGTPSDGEPEAPHPDFQGTTPYEDYVRASVLTHLQHPLSDDPGEMVFLVTTQVMELWFTVIVHEWRTAGRALRRDDLPAAMAALGRSARELQSLNASWQPLAHLTPVQFNAYRGA